MGTFEEDFFDSEEGWDEDEREPTLRDSVWWYVQRIVAVIALLGLLFLSGIYQGSFFRRTPDRMQEPLTSVVNAELLVVPLRVVVFESTGARGSDRDVENVEALVVNANALWRQADMVFVIDDVVFRQVSDETVTSFLAQPAELIEAFADRAFGGIHVFLLRGLSGLNGIAFSGAETVAVADFTTTLDYRTLAHELGHVLGLPHTNDRRDLMFSGSNGTTLSREEVETARRAAEQFRATIGIEP